METKNYAAQNAALPEKTALTAASASKLPKTQQNGDVTIAAGRGLSDRQIEILEKRGIDLEMAIRLGWRSAGQKGTGELIELPYYKKGKEINFKTRSLEGEKRFYQKEGAEKSLYNVDMIGEVGDGVLVITEGELDCCIALQMGINAISVPDGAPAKAIGDNPSIKYEYLKDIPSSIKKIVLAVDNDAPGMNLLHDLTLRLGAHRCLWVQYPEGCKDLNDVYLAHGKKAVTDCIENAKYMPLSGIYLMEELPPLTMPPALHVGIKALEDNFKLRRGDLSVVTGVPSHGKSTWANQIAVNMAINHGWHTCFASFEQPPQTEHRMALRTIFSGRPAHLLSPEERSRADKFIQSQFSFIMPGNDFEVVNLPWVMDRMALAVIRYNARLIIIDPWNELDHEHGMDMTTTQYVGLAIKKLKHFARNYMCHVMIVAHPAKLRRDKDGNYPIPSAYDIADSSHFYNKPDQVIVVHRTEGKKTLIRIAKSRYHYALGKPGDVELTYDDYNYRFA